MGAPGGASRIRILALAAYIAGYATGGGSGIDRRVSISSAIALALLVVFPDVRNKKSPLRAPMAVLTVVTEAQS